MDARAQYVELPYTLPQDYLLYVVMKEDTTKIWRDKIDWIAEKGGMALLITHPDYMKFDEGNGSHDEYPVALYREFLKYLTDRYEGQFWHALPREVANFMRVSRNDTQISAME